MYETKASIPQESKKKPLAIHNSRTLQSDPEKHMRHVKPEASKQGQRKKEKKKAIDKNLSI